MSAPKISWVSSAKDTATREVSAETALEAIRTGGKELRKQIESIRAATLNGNGGKRRSQYHGRGYQLFGAMGWLARAAYQLPKDGKGVRRLVVRFLKDLIHLSRVFGLIVAARQTETGEWHDLDQMLRFSRRLSAISVRQTTCARATDSRRGACRLIWNNVSAESMAPGFNRGEKQRIAAGLRTSARMM